MGVRKKIVYKILSFSEKLEGSYPSLPSTVVTVQLFHGIINATFRDTTIRKHARGATVVSLPCDSIPTYI
jgi:hypothetical protein